jgi:DNA-binding PadR family transcriptional regulator
LKYLMTSPQAERSGADMSKATGVGSGTLYPLLARLENANWLISRWEEIDPKDASRPRRRYYKLTANGQNAAAKALSTLQMEGQLSWVG